MTAAKLNGAVDFGYLEGFAAGDEAIIEEVLGLFHEQAQGWARQLAPPSDGWRDVVHTIKGTSRGIGAFALGDACAAAERAGEGALPAVARALEATMDDIARYRSGAR